MRRWKVNYYNQKVSAFFVISKGDRQGFSSPNPKDSQKYKEIMMDELKFRKLFSDKQSLIEYEKFLEE